MSGFSGSKRLFFRCIWVFLALVCTFCLFLPHIHECEGMECAICVLSTLFTELPLPAAATTALCCAAGILSRRRFLGWAQNRFSLVELKVKLSD